MLEDKELKIFILGILLITALNAQLLVLQNIKALYQNVHLTEEETKYIIANKEINIDAILMASIKYQEELNKLTTKDKDVIEFTLTDNLEINHLNFLVHSNNPEIDKLTEEIIKNTKFTKPKNNLKIRYILIYDYENRSQLITAKVPIISQEVPKATIAEENIESLETPKKEIPKKEDLGELFDKQIVRGTTRFKHTTQEYMRLFETNQDGFVKASNKACASMKILTLNNQRINTGYNPWNFKAPLVKGKYKLAIKTSEDCDVNIEYP
jgi:hypothetical protein